jgi:hypothetical protein
MGASYGVYGESWSSNGAGVYGTGFRAVVGEAKATSGNTFGVIGYTSSPSGWSGFFRNTSSGLALRAQTDEGSGNIIEAWSSFSEQEFRVERDGDVRADGSFQSPAADYAELLPGAAGLEAGDVLVIDEDGELARATQPYQISVAGVFSTDPAFVAGAAEDDEGMEGQVPLAVMGVVPVKVSAENGPVRPGDLLASSATPGHAMRAVQDALPGTIIGKALQGLDEGTGVIKMLVWPG